MRSVYLAGGQITPSTIPALHVSFNSACLCLFHICFLYGRLSLGSGFTPIIWDDLIISRSLASLHFQDPFTNKVIFMGSRDWNGNPSFWGSIFQPTLPIRSLILPGIIIHYYQVKSALVVSRILSME